MLAGLEPPQQGQVSWQGQAVHAPSRQVGLMFQNPDGSDHLSTVEEEPALVMAERAWHRPLRRQGGRAAVPAGPRPGRLGAACRGRVEPGPAPGGALAGQGGRPSCVCCCWTSPTPAWICPARCAWPPTWPAARSKSSSPPTCWSMCAPTRACCGLEQGQVRADGPGAAVCAAYEAWARAQAFLAVFSSVSIPSVATWAS